MTDLPAPVLMTLRLAEALSRFSGQPAPGNADLARGLDIAVSSVPRHLCFAVEIGLIEVQYLGKGTRQFRDGRGRWATMPSAAGRGRSEGDGTTALAISPRLPGAREDEALRAAWPDPAETPQTIADQIGRNRNWVYGRAHVLGLGARPSETAQRAARAHLLELAPRTEALLAHLRGMAGRPAPTNAALAKVLGVQANAVAWYVRQAVRAGRVVITRSEGGARAFSCPAWRWATLPSRVAPGLHDVAPPASSGRTDLWPAERDALLRRHYTVEGKSLLRIAQLLGLSKGQVSGRAKRLGLVKALPRPPERVVPKASAAAARPRQEARPARMPMDPLAPIARHQRAAQARPPKATKAAIRALLLSPPAPIPPQAEGAGQGCRWPLWPDMGRATHEYCDAPRGQRFVAGGGWVQDIYCPACRQRSMARYRQAEAA